MAYSLQVARRATDHYVAGIGDLQEDGARPGTIQWCHDQLPSYGGAIELTQGEYSSTGPIIFTKPVVLFSFKEAGLWGRATLKLDPSSAGDLLDIQSPDCLLEHFNVGYDGTNAESLINIDAADVTVKNVGFLEHLSTVGIRINATAPRAIIDSCHWPYGYNQNTSMNIYGNNAVVKSNRMEGISAWGIYVQSSSIGCTFDDNDIVHGQGVGCIRIMGDDHVVTNNTIHRTAAIAFPCIELIGDDNLCAGNNVYGAGVSASHSIGVRISGDNNFIVGNTFHFLYAWYQVTGGTANILYQNDFPICGAGNSDAGTNTKFHNPGWFT